LAQSIDRIAICGYYIKSLRTGELTASQQIAPHIAEGAVSRFNGDTYKGRDELLSRVTGKWPMTHIMRRAGWSEPVEEGDHLVVTAEYPPWISQRRVSRVIFTFNDRDEVTEVTHEVVALPDRLKTNEVPLVVRGLVNDAVSNNTPICIAHINEDGEPVLSFRGSLQFFGPRQLSAWLRNPEGGLASSVPKNPKVALLYRDNDKLITVNIRGLAHIETGEEVRRQVYDMMPEVEQTHDPERTGACLIIDIKSIKCTIASQSIQVDLQG
jgi:hypothetical protein